MRQTAAFTPEDVPEGLARTVRRHHVPGEPSAQEWLAGLPGLVDEALQSWQLRQDGRAWHGTAALVLPVRRSDAGAAVLKVVRPHPEARDEHLALRAWRGRRAVDLLAAAPARWTLLLQRLEADRDLLSGSVLDSCAEIGGLLRDLDQPAPPWGHRLSTHLHALVADIDRAQADPAAAHRFPRRLLQVARSLALEQASSPDVDDRLVHGDLHQGNVLWSPDQGGWRAIDPQAVAGHPTFGVAPAVRNRWAEAQASPDLRTHLAARVDVVCDAAGLDVGRARAMTLLRSVRDALWALDFPARDTAQEITRAVTIAKVMLPG